MSDGNIETGCQGVWAESVLKGMLWCDVHDRQATDWDGCDLSSTSACSIRVLGTALTPRDTG